MSEIFQDILNSSYLELCSMWNNRQWEKFVAWAVAGYFAVQAVMRGYTAASYVGSKSVAVFKYLFIPQVPAPSNLCHAVCRMLEHGDCKWDEKEKLLTCGDLRVKYYSGVGLKSVAMVFDGLDDLLKFVNEYDATRMVEVAKRRCDELMQQAREDKINQMILSAGKHYRKTVHECDDSDCCSYPPPQDDVPIIAKMTPALATSVNCNTGRLPACGVNSKKGAK